MPEADLLDLEPPEADHDTNSLSTIDLNRTPLGSSPIAPAPQDSALGNGQILFHLALGAQPEDFHPALQPSARSLGLLFQLQPKLGPGLLGSADDIQAVKGALPSSTTSDQGVGGDGDNQPRFDDVAAELRDRDRFYLDRYYDAVKRYAQQYRVNPALPLGLGIESSFATRGTYLDTKDAFGMTGGSRAHMTSAASPEENVRQLFDLYGQQIYGAGDDVAAFISGLQGRDRKGQIVPGWRVYNSRYPRQWEDMARNGIGQMRRALPLYLSTKVAQAKVKS